MKLKISPLLIIFILSILNGSFYSFYFINNIFADANQFDTLAKNILNGHYSLSKDTPYIPTMHREPLYPLFLSIIYKLFGYNHFFVYFFQILIFSLISIFTFILAKNIFTKRVAFLSGIIISILPTLANYSGFILSELLFTLVLLITIYFFQLSFNLRKNYLFFFAGIFLALSTLIKSYMLLFIFIVILAMIYNFKNLKKNFLTKLLLLFLGFSVFVSPWSYRNYNQFDTFQLTLRGGSTLWMASDFIDSSSKTIFKNFIFNFSEYLGSQIYKENSINPQKVILGRVNKYTDRINELRNQGFSDEIIENMLAEEAMLKIIKNPITYILQRFLELQKQISFLYIPSLNQYDIDLYLKTNITKNLYLADYKYGNLILSLIRFPFKILSYTFFILTIYAIIKNKHRLEKTFFPSIIILYTLAIYSLLFGLGRYGVPLIPFYVIFSSWAILYIGEKIRKKKKNINFLQ